MSNSEFKSATVVPELPVEREHLIYQALPRSVIEFVRERLVVSMSWQEVADVYRRVGEQRLIEMLQDANRDLMVEAYGPSILNCYSPYRLLSRP